MRKDRSGLRDRHRVRAGECECQQGRIEDPKSHKTDTPSRKSDGERSVMGVERGCGGCIKQYQDGGEDRWRAERARGGLAGKAVPARPA